MRRTPIALLSTAACAILALPAFASPDVGTKDNGWSIADEKYLKAYERCFDAFGSDCGRNLLESAWTDSAPVPRARVVASTARIERWLSPPEPPASSSSVDIVAAAPAPTTVPTTSAGGCPSSMYAESGSAGYGAYNASSGATGCYQIIPSTAAAHGCDLSTPDGQDACAQSICATQGPSAWSASGANPC